MKKTHSIEFIKKIHDSSYSDIAKQIRKDLKEEFKKDFKFSVKTETYAGGGSINICILQGNINFYTTEYEEATLLYKTSSNIDNEEKMNNLYNERYTKEGKKIIEEVERIYNQYNHDNSDSMTDYFDVNYYGQVEIGRRDKEYIKI